MRVFHYYPRALIGDGGVTKVVWRYLNAQIKYSVNKTYVICESYKGKENKNFIVIIKRINLIFFKIPILKINKFSKNDVFIFHSVFLIENIIIASFLKFFDIKYYVIPHGGYNQKVINKNFLLKKIFIFVFERSYLENSQAVLPFFKSEILPIKNISSKIICHPLFHPFEAQRKFINKSRVNKNYISWIGRYDILVKGIDIMIEVYSKIPNKLKIPLILHGRDSTNSLDDIKKLIAKYNQERFIRAYGPINDELTKYKFISESKFFIHLSRNEGMGVAILEALSLDVPVLISNDVPMSVLINKDKFSFTTNLEISEIVKKLSYLLEVKKIITKKKPSYIFKYFKDKDIVLKIDKLFNLRGNKLPIN